MVGSMALASLLSLAALVGAIDTSLSTPEFDYFMFVRQWPGTFCSSHECPLVHTHGFRMTIHGLWPNYNDGTWPSFCDPQYKFDDDAVADLIPDLKEAWPTEFDSNEAFWQHEWEKHGTCSLSVLSSEKRYFKTTLKLHWEYDIAAAFRAKEILPSNTQTYPRADLEAAIKSMFAVDSIVKCDESGKLTEIWMCVSKDLELMECPANAMAAFSGGDGELVGAAASSNKCDQISIPLMPRAAAGASTSVRGGEGGGSMTEGLLKESHITRPYFKEKAIASKRQKDKGEEGDDNEDDNEDDSDDDDDEDDDDDDEDDDDDDEDTNEDEDDEDTNEDEDEDDSDGDKAEHSSSHHHQSRHHEWTRGSEDQEDQDGFYPPPPPPISLFLLFTLLGALLGVGLVTLKSSWVKSRLLAFDYHAVPATISQQESMRSFQMSTEATNKV